MRGISGVSTAVGGDVRADICTPMTASTKADSIKATSIDVVKHL